MEPDKQAPKPSLIAPCYAGKTALPAAGSELSAAALEACLAESNGSVQQLQAHCDSLQAQLNLMEAAHAADMEAMTRQLAEAAGSVAAKEVVTRWDTCGDLHTHSCWVTHAKGHHPSFLCAPSWILHTKQPLPQAMPAEYVQFGSSTLQLRPKVYKFAVWRCFSLGAI